jgi:hypothetical protein
MKVRIIVSNIRIEYYAEVDDFEAGRVFALEQLEALGLPSKGVGISVREVKA